MWDNVQRVLLCDQGCIGSTIHFDLGRSSLHVLYITRSFLRAFFFCLRMLNPAKHPQRSSAVKEAVWR